jgi:hypothetical protein
MAAPAPPSWSPEAPPAKEVDRRQESYRLRLDSNLPTESPTS